MVYTGDFHTHQAKNWNAVDERATVAAGKRGSEKRVRRRLGGRVEYRTGRGRPTQNNNELGGREILELDCLYAVTLWWRLVVTTASRGAAGDLLWDHHPCSKGLGVATEKQRAKLL